MEESKALNKLMEAADLIGMIEDLTSAGVLDRLSNGSWAGIRINLKNIKESILSSHDVLAQELVQRSRQVVESGMAASSRSSAVNRMMGEQSAPSTAPQAFNETNRPQMTRKDLRSALEKVTER